MRSLVPMVVIATAVAMCQGSLARAAWGSDERVWRDDALCKAKARNLERWRIMSAGLH